MDNKSLKKSTMKQLQTLVQHMEENPNLARGAPVIGANKTTLDEEWNKLCSKLNSNGPPTRTIAEWKKSWVDLKSRTKKKIAENKRSLRETGGGLYRYSNLTELEVAIDRTLHLSSAAAPGSVFGSEVKTIDESFAALVESPPRCSKSFAVITPTRIILSAEKVPPGHVSKSQPQIVTVQKRQQSCLSDSETEKGTSHSAKKRKKSDEQLSLIRRQLKVAEQNAATAREQVTAMKRIADAAEKSATAFEAKAQSISELLFYLIENNKKQ